MTNEPTPPRRRRAKFDSETVQGFIVEFLNESADLTVKAWDSWAKTSGAPTNSGVARHVGGGTFSEAITRQAREHGLPSKAYVWPICPAGLRHQTFAYFVGTPVAHSAGACNVCGRMRQLREEWVAAQPTFAELYPHLVAFLADPVEADSRAVKVQFRCSRCGHHPINWSPRWQGLPCCGHCRDANGLPPGAIIPRRGGGVEVRLEVAVAAELVRASVPATAGFGVVLNPNTYYVGIAKPDVVLVADAVAVEIDNRPGANRHHTTAGEADDRLRDRLLATAGWRVLRIRRPDAPRDDAWPWRIETTSDAPKKLAQLIIEAIGTTSATLVSGGSSPDAMMTTDGPAGGSKQ